MYFFINYLSFVLLVSLYTSRVVLRTIGVSDYGIYNVVAGFVSLFSFLNSALFSKNFKNMTRNHRYELIKVPVGVAYGTDIEQVRQLLIQALAPICQEKADDGQTLTDTSIPITVAFSEFGESSVDLKVCIWMLVEQKLSITARVKEIIYNTLNQNNIEIPFPQRDIHIKQTQQG